MGPSHVTGGAATHSHGPGTLAAPAHTHSDGTYAAAAHTHSSGTYGVASHTHSLSVSGTTGAAGGHDHSVSGTTGGESNGSAIMDAGGDMNCVRAPHTHTYNTRTSMLGDHSHAFSGAGTSGAASPDVAGDSGSNGADVTGVSGPASATALVGASDAQANNPLYVDFYACQKN
jgi:hypothetical protein